MAAPDLTAAQWRTSSFSGNNGTCVQIAAVPDGRIAVRNSNHPEDGILLSPHTEINALITRIKTGELDNPT